MTRFKRLIRRTSVLHAQTLALLAVLCISAAAHAAMTCNAQKYGAKPDGNTNDTHALQSAIDACAAKGGKVVLAGGTFLSGPLVLRSNIDLDIAAGATLLGSSNHDDYPEITEFRNPGRQSLLSAKNAENISITGGGAIDGAGQSWWAEARSHRDHGVMEVGNVFRPRLIVFDHCKHILIKGVTVQNSPFWQIVPYYSDDMTHPQHRILAPTRTRPIPTPSILSPRPTCASITLRRRG